VIDLEQHQAEIEKNLRFWNNKPLLQQIYAGFYQSIVNLIDPTIRGAVLEVGSGIGNLKTHCPGAICSDLFPNPWLDLVCDGYELPFAEGSLSHLVLFDVFHHLEAPWAFLKEARRVLAAGGRLILFDPYISLASFPVYGLLHHEPVGWRKPIETRDIAPQPRAYYAAQGNATRLYFGREKARALAGWKLLHAEAFAAFSYLLSGGYSKPAFYPRSLLPVLSALDRGLSGWPRLFGGRCLVSLTPAG
jgi:SAM-dependent methyltransferase